MFIKWQEIAVVALALVVFGQKCDIQSQDKRIDKLELEVGVLSRVVQPPMGECVVEGPDALPKSE